MAGTKELKRMTAGQFRKAAALIKRECAGYFDGNCIYLDGGKETPCPQMLTRSLICRYFRSSVLPGDMALCAELERSDNFKKCVICGKPFRAASNRAKYCESCARNEKRKASRERVRKYRGRHVTV